MLNKLLKKEILIPVIALLLALIVGIAILGPSESEDTGGKESNTKTEQSKDDVDSQGDKEETGTDDKGGTGLNMLEPDEVDIDDYSDTTGLWGDTQETNSQTGDTDKTDDTDKTEDTTPEEDKKDESDTSEEDQDILKDNISWGDIY